MKKIESSRKAIKSSGLKIEGENPYRSFVRNPEGTVKKRNDWRGVPGVKMIWHGEWADPELEYDGMTVNYYDVEESLYEYAKELGINADDDYEFNEWLQSNPDTVYNEISEFSGVYEQDDDIYSSRKAIKSEMTSRQYQNAIDKAARMITEGERDVQKICKMTKLDESDVQAIIDEQDEFENEINSSHKITQSKERSIMNGAIKELEELFSTKAKGNTVYFNDVNYTPLPLPVQNAVKAIMEEYPDMKYRMGLYSVTVFDKGQSIKSSRRPIKSGYSDVEKALNELEDYFDRGADGNTIYTRISHDDENHIAKVCEDYNVDFAVGSYHVTLYPIESSRRIQSRNTSDSMDSITSSGAFADRDESDNPECIIEIKKDGKWKPVGIDKNAESGWSTEVKFTVFESEDKARKSGMARRVQNEGYSEKDGTLRFSTK